MRALKVSAVFVAVLALASLSVSGSSRPAESDFGASRAFADDPLLNSQGPPPSAQEIRARADLFVANQHQDDQASSSTNASSITWIAPLVPTRAYSKTGSTAWCQQAPDWRESCFAKMASPSTKPPTIARCRI